MTSDPLFYIVKDSVYLYLPSKKIFHKPIDLYIASTLDTSSGP